MRQLKVIIENMLQTLPLLLSSLAGWGWGVQFVIRGCFRISATNLITFLIWSLWCLNQNFFLSSNKLHVSMKFLVYRYYLHVDLPHITRKRLSDACWNVLHWISCLFSLIWESVAQYFDRGMRASCACQRKHVFLKCLGVLVSVFILIALLLACYIVNNQYDFIFVFQSNLV